MIRILVVGAGAVGGYFGGRLIEANRDVTFLVRPKRAEELAATGLVIRDRLNGDFTAPVPKTVLAETIHDHFDVVLLSCKAFDLDNAIASFSAAVGPDTMILPLLNGMRHLQLLDDHFGAQRVLGGQCQIAATLNDKREVVHLNDKHAMSFGERDGSMSKRIDAVRQTMAGVRFEAAASATILLDMWEKWVFLATLAAGTCLMRAAVGDIGEAPGGSDLMLGLLEECRSIAVSQGHPPREEFLQRIRAMLTASGSPLTASMLRDVEGRGPIESDHIIGDLLSRASQSAPLLSLAFSNLKSYEARRRRELSA